MDYQKLFNTVRYLRPRQVFYQIFYRIRKAGYKRYRRPGSGLCLVFKTRPIDKPTCLKQDEFSFLNISKAFPGWDDASDGMLWTYNLNYMDWLCQSGMREKLGLFWIDKFIAELPDNSVGLDPYPTALRGVNWVKFFVLYPEAMNEKRLDSLYSQYRLLEKKLEYHILGNHLLENAYSLYIGGSFFSDSRMKKKAYALLLKQLKRQVLPDGAHFEQSPMYHCILLDRLLDCINIAPTAKLESYASRMLGHLENLRWADGSIPMFNDSAMGIAPSADQIFDYAKRLGIGWTARPMKESGYRRMTCGRIEAVVDVGNITATYQPGHTHSDALSYELKIGGSPVVVDTGISTYDKTPRRQYERSSAAHNAVVVDGMDSYEVWGGFRVGKRGKVSVSSEDRGSVNATLRFNGITHNRIFEISDNSFTVSDIVAGGNSRQSLIHLAPEVGDVRVEGGVVYAKGFRIEIEGADSVSLEDCQISREYNRFLSAKVLVITFTERMSYKIIVD